MAQTTINTLPRVDAPTPASELLAGAKATIPLVIGAIPFGIIFGTLSSISGLSFWGTMAMSSIVFAGSAQFIALNLLAAGAAWPIIVATTFVVNLRHMLYAAALVPYVKHLSARWHLPIAFTLTDETFAVVIDRFQTEDGAPNKHWF